MAFVLWSLGYPDQALKRAYEALTLAQRFSHPSSLVLALIGVTGVHLFRREAPATQEWAEATIALCTEQGFAQLLALGTLRRGWTLAEQGQGEVGIAQIRQGLAAWQATGANTLLAEAYGKAGQAEEGLSTLSEALTLVNRTGERFFEAELYRLKGQLKLQEANQKSKGKRQKAKMTSPQPLTPSSQAEAEAEAFFQKSIAIARQQQTKSLELRATTSLARLWQSQGKQREAHQMLAEIYNWFTEGFDTKDLQETQTLLQDLADHRKV